MDEQSLARSACRIFGHVWGRPRYAALRVPSQTRGSSLHIRRQRVCTRCGAVESLER